MAAVVKWLLVAVALVAIGALFSFTDVFQAAILGGALGMVGLLMLLFGAAVLLALLFRGFFVSRRPDEPRGGRLT